MWSLAMLHEILPDARSAAHQLRGPRRQVPGPARGDVAEGV